MSKARSPRYPQIGLKEAIERVKMVYEKDHQNPIPKNVVADHMGYRSLNGKSLGVISAVSKYGLLEGRAQEMRVSDRALDIIAHDAGTPERVAAITAAAKQPELFSELQGRFPDGKASDAAIRSHLLTQKKFLPNAADVLIRAYKETIDLLATEKGGLDSITDDSSEGGVSEPAEAAVPDISTWEPVIVHQPTRAPAGEREVFRGPLSLHTTYRLFVTGTFGPKEIENLISELQLKKTWLSNATESEEGNSTSSKKS